VTARLIQWFPLWAAPLIVWAWFQPAPWSDGKPAIVPLLVVIMFCMGLTLNWSHFRSVLQKPGLVLLGVGLQYLVMPLAAFILSLVFHLEAAESAGMILVGSSAGGTASNVICYLARGNVALSVLMTLSSTLLAIAATPLLTLLYLHQTVPVPALQMLYSLLEIVLLPLLAGIILNTCLNSWIRRIRPLLPLAATLAIAVIIAIIIALNHDSLTRAGPTVIAAVMLHNLCGLLAGYGFPALLGYDRTLCRTVAIEVGMQNSGLSVALAIKYFSPAAALPGALFSLWHNLSGTLLAAHWRRTHDETP